MGGLRGKGAPDATTWDLHIKGFGGWTPMLVPMGLRLPRLWFVGVFRGDGGRV